MDYCHSFIVQLFFIASRIGYNSSLQITLHPLLALHAETNAINGQSANTHEEITHSKTAIHKTIVDITIKNDFMFLCAAQTLDYKTSEKTAKFYFLKGQTKFSSKKVEFLSCNSSEIHNSFAAFPSLLEIKKHQFCNYKKPWVLATPGNLTQELSIMINSLIGMPFVM
ncbi:hypothetical protein H0W26_01565 [Candidatus Dependentiae bacterium]|nr:hypothetical protein [Candidatus Dependentiae bacterium]